MSKQAFLFKSIHNEEYCIVNTFFSDNVGHISLQNHQIPNCYFIDPFRIIFYDMLGYCFSKNVKTNIKFNKIHIKLPKVPFLNFMFLIDSNSSL